jgi:D-alanyl-D-alanine dipeptidase
MNRLNLAPEAFEYSEEWEPYTDTRELEEKLVAFTPTPVESPGGGRIREKRPPSPDNLTTVPGLGKRRIKLYRFAAAGWQALVAAARADGIHSPLLLPVSGYRDPNRQATLWAAAVKRYGSPKEARRWVAPPGGSAHQTGRAIDFYLGGRNSSANVGTLRQTRAYQWLVANAERFGFYPYEREPWHWEYNPPATREFEMFAGTNSESEDAEQYEDEGIGDVLEI